MNGRQSNRLAYRLVDNEIFLLNLSISDLKGNELLKVSENHLKYKVYDITFNRRPGRINVTTTRILDFVPIWAMPVIMELTEYKIQNGVLTLLDVEVLKPGIIKVEGFWSRAETVIIVTHKSLNFIRPGYKRAISLVGEGEDSYYIGPEK